MRQITFALFIFALTPQLAFSFDTSVKGFIALDALNYEKIQRKDGAAVIGIGVLDLKIFAEQDNMTAAIKLNIDANLSVQNSIFEEAYAAYRGIKDWKFTLGKGVVKFQNLHWGGVENTYLDGGSLLGTENSWRKVSNKALASVAYGHRSRGFINHVTIWGDSIEIATDDSGKPQYKTTSGSGNSKIITAYDTNNVPAFNTSKQVGFANKLELFPNDNWTFTSGQIYYKNKLAPKKSYAIDFGASKESNDTEYWIDLLYGFSSKAPYESYTTLAKSEYFIQLGTQYHIDEIWSLIENAEFLYIKDQSHTYSDLDVDGLTYKTDSKLDKAGQSVKTTNYKFESAVQYQLSKSSFMTIGGLYERKLASQNGIKNLSYIKGVNNANAEAFKLSSSVSFWF
jgi:hypothetical protein